MGGHDSDNVVKQRRSLVRAGGNKLHQHRNKGLYHASDLRRVILGDPRVAHRVENNVCDDLSGGSLAAAHERGHDPREIFLCILGKALLYGVPLVGICAYERKYELLKIVLRRVHLGSCGKDLREQLPDKVVKELTLGHNITADTADDLIGGSARGHGDILEIVDAVFARVLEGGEYLQHFRLELSIVVVELCGGHDMVNAVSGKAHALGRHLSNEVVVVYDVVYIVVDLLTDIIYIGAHGGLKGVNVKVLDRESYIFTDALPGHYHVVEPAAE